MRIILENELERKVWPVLMAAHYKWEKNHGDSLRGQMEWYLNDLYKEETEEWIITEVKRRLKDNNLGYEPGMTVEQYIQQNVEDLDLEPAELEEHKKDLTEDYQEIKEDYESIREGHEYDVREELRNFYFCLFNAPEDLTVEYNGEIIQPAIKG